MTLKRKLLTSGLAIPLLLPLVFTVGQARRIFVTLHVKRDGNSKPSPERVTLMFDGQSVALPLHGGRFEVPWAALGTKNIRLVMKLGDEEIRISGIYGSEFRQDDWTLILADRQYDADNQWVVPKGASVRSSCILVFQSKSTEGTALFAPHCRYPSAPRKGQ